MSLNIPDLYVDPWKSLTLEKCKIMEFLKQHKSFQRIIIN